MPSVFLFLVAGLIILNFKKMKFLAGSNEQPRRINRNVARAIDGLPAKGLAEKVLKTGEVPGDQGYMGNGHGGYCALLK